MASVLDAIRDYCLTEGLEKTYWVAYSGGLDSHVLLHNIAKLREELPIKIRVIHIHHGLNPNADAWLKHCERVCAELKLDWLSQRVNVNVTAGESPEEVARRCRYAAFTDLLAEDDIVLTAHHQDDQAETVLLQLLRGAGPKGLSAMPRIKPLGKGWLMRPLLGFTRQELMQYATEHQLQWIEDDSNTDENFSRNFLRHKILPELRGRWPSVTKTLARVADNCAEAQRLLTSLADEGGVAARGSQPNTLSVHYLKKLPRERQQLLLREWLYAQDFLAPPAKKMQSILQDMLLAGEDKAPLVCWGDVELRRYRDDLYAQKRTVNQMHQKEWLWDLAKPLTIPGWGVLQAELSQGRGLRADIQQVTVRFRQGGEKLKLPGRSMHHSLKKLFQEWGVLPWERDKVPLLYHQGELVAVVGYTVCEGHQTSVGATGWSPMRV